MKKIFIFLGIVAILSLVYFFHNDSPKTDLSNISIPPNYTLESYTIAEVTGEKCVKSEECKTPTNYLIRSSCPYVSICLKNACTVVCPNLK